MIIRLGFAVVLAFGFLVAPLAVDAQPTRTPRVGVLYFLTLQVANRCDVGFRQGLAELGYVEGKSLFLEVRSAEGKVDRLRELAAELVRLKVDVIFAPGTVVAQSVKQAKATVPIVFASAADRSGRGSSKGSDVPEGISRDCPSLLAYGVTEHVEAGGLMAYGADVGHNCRRAATFVDKILKGANPATLPVEQPTKFELVIKTAKALGLTIPPSLLVRAAEVIQ